MLVEVNEFKDASSHNYISSNCAMNDKLRACVSTEITGF
jgi:hypothetical protein